MEPEYYDPSRILVRFRPEAGCKALACDRFTAADVLPGSTLEGGTDLVPGLQQVRLSAALSVERALEAYRAHPLVDYAEPDYHIQLAGFPDDPRFGEQWNLHNTGQTGGSVDADVDAPEAWRANTGAGGTIVAVVDTGVDYTHPDLAANMWTNPGEVPGDGLDNDGNGFIDDVFGYDFANSDGDPFDDNGHGTHVAGVLGAVGNNAVGVAGVNWDVRIMALKFLDAAGNGTIANAISALNYAVAHGATISNHSWETSAFSSALRDAIANAQTSGHIVVAAAGNGGPDLIGDDTDANRIYPAGFNFDNVVAVAATDHNDRLAPFSNFGANSVDLGAPGVNILSTVPAAGPNAHPSGYRLLSGTSLATPHVSGVLALLHDQHPNWNYRQLIDRLIATVDPLDDLQSKSVSGGRLSAGAAIASTFPFQFNIGSVLSDAALDIATDPQGNVYVTGSFFNPQGAEAPIDFDLNDDTPEPSDFLTSRGGADIFVAKYSERGDLIWARSMGGQSQDEALAVTVDQNGNVYTTGRFAGIADFNPAPGNAVFLLNNSGFNPEISETQCRALLQSTGFGEVLDDALSPCRDVLQKISNEGTGDVFISKLDRNGNFIWARNAGGSAAVGNDIATDAVGNVFLTGHFFGLADFNPGPSAFELGSLANGTSQAFVASLRPDGSFRWARETGLQSDNDTASGLAVTAEGDVFVTGTHEILSAGNHAFLQRLTANGAVVWNQMLPSVSGARSVSTDIALGDSNAPLISGHFLGPVDFDPGPDTVAPLNNGGTDVFVARYDPATGALVWVQTIGGLEDDRGLSLATDTNGFVYTTGTFRGIVDFDPGIPELERISDSGTDDVFIWKLGDNGNFDDVFQMGGPDADAGTGIALDPFGNVLLTGIFRGSASFSLDPNADLLTSNGDTDVFVTKIVQPLPPLGPVPAPPPPPPPPAPAPPPPDQMAVFRSGLWFFDLDSAGAAAENAFAFGVPSDVPVSGDWDGDGTTDAAVFRDGLWFFDLDHAGGAAEHAIAFGIPGDIPVAGDWDGDGIAEAAVYRNGVWFFDLDGAGGSAEAAFAFGDASDTPVPGDWNGDGLTDAAVFRNGLWFFDLDHLGGTAEHAIAFGIPGDVPVVGDWNADGIDDAAIYRNGLWFFDRDGHGAAAESATLFGIAGDIPLAGLWQLPPTARMAAQTSSNSAATRVFVPPTLESSSAASQTTDESRDGSVLEHRVPTVIPLPPNQDRSAPTDRTNEKPSFAELVDEALLALTEQWSQPDIAGLLGAEGI